MNNNNIALPHSSSYRTEIDGLRAFAVLAVVAFHAFPQWIRGGFIGVDVFFVISGFLITSHIFENLDKSQFRFSDFFSRRVRRLFPALIVVMASSLIFGFFMLIADEFSQLGKHVASGATFITNFILVNESGYFDNSAETKPMLHLWSLAVEEQFYIVWPLVLWFAWKRKFNLLTITVIGAALSFYVNLRYVNTHPTGTFFWPMGRFWELLIGSILAWNLLYNLGTLAQLKLRVDKFLVRIIHTSEVEADGTTTSNLMALVGFLLLIYGLARINEDLLFPYTWALIPVLGATLIISAGSHAWLNRIFLMNPISVWFGLISYPLYLWHWPILSFLQIIEAETLHTTTRIIAILLSIVLAWITYRFVEIPIRYSYPSRKSIVFLLVTMLFSIGGVGYYISISDWSEIKGYEDVLITRKGFEHGFGASMKWYEGKDNWLFLGNDYSQTVAKRRLAFEPSEERILNEVNRFNTITQKASESGTKVALLIGPNKSSVYTEYLPDEIQPSVKRYSTFITDRLNEVSNLTLVDPTDLLVNAKSKEGYLYWRTDTHWNQKGAYIAFGLLMERLELILPQVSFSQSDKARNGDLISISKLNDFPVLSGDDWSFALKNESDISKVPLKDYPQDSFGWRGHGLNTQALNEKTVWIVGDSFTSALRPYIEASFKEFKYLGHLSSTLDSVPSLLQSAKEKPDLILVVRVERGF